MARDNSNHPTGKTTANARNKRLDVEIAHRHLAATRSQAEGFVRLGKVTVNGKTVTKPGRLVTEGDQIHLLINEQYVSRAALKLQSADAAFHIPWAGATVMDVGSSTGGFTQYALKHGAAKVIAVDVGTDQLHKSLRGLPEIELHEKTDIRGFTPAQPIDIVVGDVSFISLREILPHIARIAPRALVIAMVKPQFEAGKVLMKNKGVIKNDTIRREVLKQFELWVQNVYKIVAKKDSEVAGAKGNIERFYLLKLVGL